MRPSFLVCRPTFYGINYQINPWMNVHRQANRALALAQWAALCRVLREECGATVRVCRARPGLPDMTFTANAGLVHSQKNGEKEFIVSSFRHAERQPEAQHFLTTAKEHQLGHRSLPSTSGGCA
mgnify:CR=1 FL=1